MNIKASFKESLRESNGVDILLSVFLLAMGLFHEFLSCAASIALFVFLCVQIKKNGKITIYLNLGFCAIALIVFFYLISTFWAVDSGSAVFGFFKFLPALLFSLLIMQKDRSEQSYLNALPISACVMTVISAILMQIPALSKYFSVAGRLSGFFQYSNSFALFLLVCVIVVATKEKPAPVDYAALAILIFGIMYSGSRTVFALLVVSLAALLIFNKNKKVKTAAMIIIAAAVLLSVLYATFTGNYKNVGRFLTTSFSESTFAGRLLYYRDALPVILKHPFGLGYLGYSYMQHSFQTGVYTVRYIHNEFLQLLLDVGWLPAIAFIAAVVKSFFTKGASLRKRLMLFIICAHAFFDFDFQYVAVLMIFLLLLDLKSGEEKELKVSFSACTAVSVAFSLVCVYFGAALSLTYIKKYEISNTFYPFNTQNQIQMLSSSNEEEADAIAERIIERNEYVSSAYRARAQYAFSQGDISLVIRYQKSAISASPFNYETYEEYANMLIYAAKLYQKSGDKQSLKVCNEELVSLENKLNALSEKQSKLGKMIDDQPVTEFSEDITEYIEKIKQ